MYYIFDGSYGGFLTCVFESFERKEHPAIPLIEAECQGDFFAESRTIITDRAKALRVQKGLQKYLEQPVTAHFFSAFLSEDRKARAASFNIMHRIFSGQHNILQNYGDSDVLYFTQTLKKVSREAHRMEGFIRFSKSSDGLFFAMIEPDFNILPLIAGFFRNRYADQPWLIYDVKRKYGLLYNKAVVSEVQLSPPEKAALSTDVAITLDEREAHFQTLWKRYYTSTNIPARRNMKLHLQHVPKRYWKYLVEKQ